LVEHFIRAAVIELPGRGALEFLVALFDVHRVARGVVGGEESAGGGPGDQQLAKLGKNDGPTEQGQEQQHTNGDLALSGGVLDGVNGGVGGQERMNNGRHISSGNRYY
jgi:hypothetical protein